jgi:CheY-like chemotaxis protein
LIGKRPAGGGPITRRDPAEDGSSRPHRPPAGYVNVVVPGTRSDLTVRVLLVEDSDDLRHLFARVLKRKGAEVREAENGRAALDCLPGFTPDLVVTDLMMPVLDGVSLIRQLKGAPATAGIPVIAVTANVTDEAGNEARQAGASEVLLKPFDMIGFADRLGVIRE